MVILTRFLINLLCASYNCQYENSAPIPFSTKDVHSQNQGSTVIYTNTGYVEGFEETIINGNKVASFEGIPYAEAPTNELRFKAPVPKRPWSGILKAQAPGPDCLQINPVRLFAVTGREDCLYLNIYVPMKEGFNKNNGSTAENFPVIIWIHGGNYFFGAGREYGPAYLLTKDVVLVTINYRLGVLGFMSTGDEVSPGNYGLKDQALAIKWVHDNVGYFGGDTKKTTIMGQSAGGTSVHFHMLSTTSVAKGLFRNAISLSGSAFHHWAIQTSAKARKVTQKFAKLMRCPSESGSSALVACLKQADANFLTAFQRHMFEIILFPVVIFAPVIEPNTTDAYIIDTPENYYARDEVAKIPWLCTNTQEEAEYMVLALKNAMLLLNYQINWKRYMPIMMDVPSREDIIISIVKHYFGSKSPTALDSRSMATVGTDRYFSLGNRRALRHHYKVAPTYSYIFGFRSRIGVIPSVFGDYKEWGASHGEDMSVIFNSTLYFKAMKPEDTDLLKMSQIVVSLITNFASKGEPLYTDENSGEDLIIWEPVKDPNNLQFLRLNFGEIKMISDPLKERLKIWEKLSIY